MHPFSSQAGNPFEWTRTHPRGTLYFGKMDSRTAALSSVGVLIEAVGRGSQVALKRLYELESRRLYGIVRRPEIAADVLQETFVQIWQNAAAFSAERGAGAAWLTGIVRFRSLDAVRKLGREVLTDDPALGDVALSLSLISIFAFISDSMMIICYGY
jgi:hypothetical protein